MVKSKNNISNNKLLEIQTMDNVDFKRYYGVSKPVFLSLCEKLPKEIKQIWILWLFSFAKDGLSLFKTAKNFGYTEKTLSEKIWFVLNCCYRTLKINDFESRKINLEERKVQDLTKDSDRNVNFALTALDTTVFPLKTADDQFYSIKHSKRCLKYEAIVTLDKGTCCFLSGPHTGSEHDLAVYRKKAAHLELLPGEKIFADKGYCCAEFSNKLITPIKKSHQTMLTNEEHCFNNWVSSNRIIVENFFKDLKIFEILKKDWRSSIDKHMKMVIENIWYKVNSSKDSQHFNTIYFNLCGNVSIIECSGVGTSVCQKLYNVDNGDFYKSFNLGYFYNVTYNSNGLILRYRSDLTGENETNTCQTGLEPRRRITDFILNCDKDQENTILKNGSEPKTCYYNITMQGRIFCDCENNCTKPHGTCLNGNCQCDQYTIGDNCEQLNIKITSIDSTTIYGGGTSYITGDFQFITSNFDVLIGGSLCSMVKLINSSTISISVPPGDGGFKDVIITDGIASYQSEIQFLYTLICPNECSQHGDCDQFTGICQCDGQTNGESCEYLNVMINSMIETTIKGGIGYLIGDFQLIPQNFDVYMDGLQCANVKLINTSTIEILVPPGDDFRMVIIQSGMSYYIAPILFQYINVPCLYNCSQPHGECNLFNGVCTCDNQTIGNGCEQLNIKIDSIISTKFKGGVGYLIGDFQFITSSFDIFIGGLQCTGVKLINTTTIEITVPPSDVGFKNVSITDGISSYLSNILFEYEDIPCLLNCSQLHGQCNLITGICECDSQTYGTGCEISSIILDSIDPTDGNGGTTLLYGYFGNTTSNLYIQIGDIQCNNIRQINQSLIQCDIGVGSGFKDVLLQDRDLKVKVNNLFQYFVPITPNPPKQCIDNCGGPDQGLCLSSGCSCISPWIGNDCKSKIVFIPQPSTNYSDPSTSIPLFDTTNNTNNQIENRLFITLISIVKLRELDFNSNEINSFTFKEWEYYKINNETSQYKTNFINLGLTTNITITLQWFNNDSTIEFGNQIINMNPSTIKYTVEISEYKFSSKLNQLQLIMKASISVNKTDEICSDKDFGETSNGDNSNYLKIQVDNHSLYGRFIKRALIDSIPRSIDNVQLDSSMKIIDSASLSQSYIGISVPYFKRNIVLDPDFSLLVGSSPSSDNSICSFNNSNNFSNTKIAAIVIGGFVGIASISTIVIYGYYKTKHDRNVINEIRLRMSTRQVDILM
ncbi:hypothetical protein ACTA71_008948 [Dictyostelium dimigraforme]